jgi:hypothetical protein
MILEVDTLDLRDQIFIYKHPCEGYECSRSIKETNQKPNRF